MFSKLAGALIATAITALFARQYKASGWLLVAGAIVAFAA